MSGIEGTARSHERRSNALQGLRVHAILLRQHRALLALVLLQFFILGSVMYLSMQRDTNVHTRFMEMIQRCVVPQPGLKSELEHLLTTGE